MNNETKQKLIQTGAKAMLAKSYHAVGIKEILAEVDVPKGSFYYYFASKEAFGIAVIEYYGGQIVQAIRLKLLDTSMTPRNRILTYFQSIRDYYAKNGCGKGCLVAKLATELSNTSPDMRNALKQQFDLWTELFAVCIREGQEMGEISSSYDAESLAEIIYIAWEGALIRMQINHDLSPIDQFIQYVVKQVLSENR